MRLAWEQAQSAITGRQRSGFNASHSHPVPCQCLVLPHECPGNRHISFVLAARGEHVRELSQQQAGDSIPVVSRAPPPQAAWPGPGGHCQGLPGCCCQHPSRKKQRMLAAIDPYGQMDSLCKAEVLHLWTCSAPWAPCLPCPASARGPGSLSLQQIQ